MRIVKLLEKLAAEAHYNSSTREAILTETPELQQAILSNKPDAIHAQFKNVGYLATPTQCI